MSKGTSTDGHQEEHKRKHCGCQGHTLVWCAHTARHASEHPALSGPRYALHQSQDLTTTSIGLGALKHLHWLINSGSMSVYQSQSSEQIDACKRLRGDSTATVPSRDHGTATDALPRLRVRARGPLARLLPAAPEPTLEHRAQPAATEQAVPCSSRVAPHAPVERDQL
eukprot:6197803-Pleurochrysis_carterae.AAC.1